MRKQFADYSITKCHDIYGVSWDKGPNPELLRIRDSVGAVANIGIDSEVVNNDFDSTALFSTIREHVDIYGNVFTLIPKIYIRKTDTPLNKTWEISLTRRPGFYLPWCYWDFTNNVELPFIAVGSYKASLGIDNKLESRPETFPLRKKTIIDFRGYAENNNVENLFGYQQLDIHVVDLLQTLFYVEFATLNSQSVMTGYTGGQYSNDHISVVAESDTNQFVLANSYANTYRIGQYVSIGTSRGGDQIAVDRMLEDIVIYDDNNKALIFDGSAVNISTGNYIYNSAWKNGFSKNIIASSGCIVANDGKYPCSYRGIESIYGDIWQFVDGINILDQQAWVCNDASKYTSNVYVHPYKKLNYINHNVNGWVKEMGWDEDLPFAEFPVSITSSSTLSQYYTDYYYREVAQKIAQLGGSWHNGATAGLSYWRLYSSSGSAGLGFGGRLLMKPVL